MRRAAVLAALSGLLLAFAQAAGAHPIAGVVPDLPSAHVARPPVAHIANLPYGGGPVLHSNRTHLIFWQPAGSGMTFDPGYEGLIEQFLRRVAAASHHPDNVYGLTGQYQDAQGPAAYASTYGGATVVNDRLPRSGCVEPGTGPGWAVCLTDLQLRAEIEHVVHSEHLPTGPTDVYFLITPKGLGSCTDTSSTSCALGGPATGYCAYHDQLSSGAPYAVIPYNAVPGHCQSSNPRPNDNTADPALSSVSHEQSEMITDPGGDAWIYKMSGDEVGDLCITTFGPALGGSGQSEWNQEIHGGHYYLQEEWSNADGGCQPRAKPDHVRFTDASSAADVSFTAHGTDPHGSIIGELWFFGDGSTGHGAQPTHQYRRAGRYRVVLRATDSWRNWTFYAEMVTVSNVGGRLVAATKSG